MGRDEWESVLTLSKILGMGGIRDMALQQLPKYMDSVDKVLLGQKCWVPSWLFEGYKELVRRTESISGPEGRRLGADMSAGICEIREAGIRACFRPVGSSGRRGNCRDHYVRTTEPHRHSYDDHIRSLFSSELADAESGRDTTLLGSARLQSSRVDNDPRILRPSRNELFYMDSIIFLVRCS